jgi:DNA-binding transcriptional LysR family regulator
MNMSFYRQIKVFRTVMTSPSLSAASGRLLISQPAITKQLKNLENYVGTKLFHRAGHRLQPTEHARRLFDQSEMAMEGMQNLDRFARSLDQNTIETLHIATMPMIARLWLPERISGILKRYLNLNVTVEVTSSSRVLDMVETGQTDIGLGLPVRPSGAIFSRNLLSNQAVCIFTIGHAFEELDVVCPSDLVGEDFLLLGPLSYTRKDILEAFDQYDVSPRIRAEIELEGLAVAMVEAGDGVSIIDEYSARKRLQQGARIAFKPFTPRINMDVQIMHNMNPKSPDLVKTVINQFLI